jgi:glycosyltransferase involved in cell wall biosynthesis
MIRVLQIFNQYRSLFNGEENVVWRTAQLIENHGGVCRVLLRSSRDLKGVLGKWQAFCSGFYNPWASYQVRRVLGEFRPHVVHAHNLLPLFSPSVLVACHRAKVPVVFTAHNQALTCPRADHLCHGRLCDLCLGGREYHCILNNCRGRWTESVAYAARSAFARTLRLYLDNIDVLIALTEFARQRLLRQGFHADQVVVLPNMVSVAESPATAAEGKYVLFAGRLSPEKGIDVLIEAARQLPDIPFLLAGGGPLEKQLQTGRPSNVTLLGQVDSVAMQAHYRNARMLVLPSRTYEMCPLVIGEAMGHAIPVVASRLGGIPELVDDGVTGLLFECGNSEHLAKCIRTLWSAPELCRRMGLAGWCKARQLYSEEAYWPKLVQIYRQAAKKAGAGWPDEATCGSDATGCSDICPASEVCAV